MEVDRYYEMRFSDFLRTQEGVFLPDAPRWKGMIRLNTTPLTNTERRKLYPKPVKPPPPVQPFKSTVREIVPPKLIQKPKTTP